MGKRHRNGNNNNNNNYPPTVVPSSFQCHVCNENHWTVKCPKLLRDPNKFPRFHLGGCYQCGRLGHRGNNCTVRRYRCADCGGMHDTKECIFSYKPKEWHEFFDPIRQKVFYVEALTKETQWATPYHMDIVFWHCDRCKILIPSDTDEVNECVLCHDERPKSVFLPEDYEENSSEEEDGDGEGEGNSATTTTAAAAVTVVSELTNGVAVAAA